MTDPKPAADAAKLAADTTTALLKAGAAAARHFAQAVSGTPPPTIPGEPPLATLVRHTSAGTATLARIMIDAARSAGDLAATAPITAPTAAAPAFAGPRVAPGGALRLPLSIDNPGDVAMAGLVPRLLAASLDGADAPAPRVEFRPKKLSIAPRDFEKLVLTVTVPADARPGLWRLVFSLDGSGEATAEIAFRVG